MTSDTTDFARLKSALQLYIAALTDYAAIPNWKDATAAADEYHAAYISLRILAAELELPTLPTVPDLQFLPGNTNATRAVGIAFENWCCDALGILRRCGKSGITPTMELPPNGTRYDNEANVPAAFREDAKPDGKVLTTPYLTESVDWLLKSPYLSKHFGEGPDKELRHRVKVGSAYAYCFVELLVLRQRLTSRQDARESD